MYLKGMRFYKAWYLNIRIQEFASHTLPLLVTAATFQCRVALEKQLFPGGKSWNHKERKLG